MTLVFFILLTTSWSSSAVNWNDPHSIASEFMNDAVNTSPRYFVHKWNAHHYTYCRYGTCTLQVGPERVRAHRDFLNAGNTEQCYVASAWWEGEGRLGVSCTNGFNDLLIFNQNGKVVREEVRS